MRKRIRDLTIQEARAICSQHKITCIGCPLQMKKKEYHGIKGISDYHYRTSCSLIITYPEDEEKFINKRIKVDS